MFKVPNLLFTRHKLQTFRNALVRFVIEMAVVPDLEALHVDPISDEPNLFGPVQGAEDFHADKAGLSIHQMRTSAKRRFHLGGLVIRNHKFAESDESAPALRYGFRLG